MLQRMLDLISSTKNFMRVYVSSTCMCNEYKIPKKKKKLCTSLQIIWKWHVNIDTW